MKELLISVRAVHFASTALVAGIVIFRFLVADEAFRKEHADRLPEVQAYQRRLRWIFWVGLALAVLSGAAWLIVLAANISGQPLAEVVFDDTAWVLLTETQFGRIWTARLFLAALLIGCRPLLNSKDTHWGWLPTACAAGLMGSLAWSGHAGGTPGANGAIHLASDFLHLLAAGAWLGGLLPFALLLALTSSAADRSLDVAAKAATLRFSTIALLSVITLLATRAVNSWALVANPHALLTTAS